MQLTEQETNVIKDLQTQEKSCIEKYGMYAGQAKDPELKKLFQTLQSKEREAHENGRKSMSSQFRSNYPRLF